MTRVLVTCGGGFQGLGMVQALRCIPGAHVMVCDIHADAPTRYACHEYLQCPALADADAFAAFLLDTVRQHHIEFVFPATARELPALASLQPSLHAAGAIAAVSPRSLLEHLLDKVATRRFLAAAGLPAETPVDPRTHDFRFPLIGKPRWGWGGRGMVTIEARDAAHVLATMDLDACAWSRRFDAFKEYSADFAIAPGGAVSPIVVRRRLRTSGGFAVISASVDDPELQALFARTAGQLAHAGGLGCFNAQAIVPQESEAAPFVSDINPRLGTSATHARAEGINLPGFFIAHARGEATAAARRPVKTVRLLCDVTIPRLPRRPRAMVLDLDDTLVDHRRWLFAKMEALYATCLREHVEEPAYRLAVAQLIDERDWPRLIDRTLELLDLPQALRERAIAAYRASEVDTPLFDDVEPALRALAQLGIRLAILTDNPPATQRAKLARAPALHRIEHVIFAREQGGEKPHASGFAAAARALDLAPRDLVMVGDNWFRDGVGAVMAGYAHALVVRRHGTRSAIEPWRSQATPAGLAQRIHVLPDLTCVQHACLDAVA